MDANELPADPPERPRRAQSGQLDAQARAMKGWSARVAGMSWREVAEVVGWSSADVACRAVKRAMGRLPAESRDDARALWRERHEALWAVALNDAKAGKSGSVRAGVAVARSAAQLDGLDEPTRAQIEVGSHEFEIVMQAVMRAEGVNLPIEAEIVDVEPEPDA